MTPKIILLTGRIASGKSTVRKMFEAKGVPCIDADAVAREIQNTKGHPCLNELQELFPGCITFNDHDLNGILNRAWMRELISKNEYANKLLVKVMTPYVMEYLNDWTNAQDDVPYVIWESALIRYGSPGIDRFLLVSMAKDLQLERIKQRNPDWTQEQIDGIMKAQDHMYRCNDIIINDTTVEDMQWEVNQLHLAYEKLWEEEV